MLKVTNLSKGPLHVRDGMYLTPGASCDCRSATDELRKYESRGWVMIHEVEPPAEQKTKEPKPEESGRKGGEK